MEAELVTRMGLPYTEVPAAGVHGVGLKNLPHNLWQVLRGIFASRRILKSFKPDVLFFTGGFVAVPMALSARFTRTNKKKPASLVFIPDVEPGLALKTIANFSVHIALTVEDTKKYLNVKIPTAVCGYPVRMELLTWAKNESKKAEAYRFFDLSPELPTLLILGGSKGARSINRAVLASLPELLDICQVIHITGQLDWEEVSAAKNTLVEKTHSEKASRYIVFSYLHEELAQAMAIADMVVSRAGASVLGELPVFGIPAILVPYPYAWRYQVVNASYLVERQAALLIRDSELSQQLLTTVKQLFDNPQRLNAMKTAMSNLAKPEAASAIARLLQLLAGGGDK